MSDDKFPRYKCHKEVSAIKIVSVIDDMIVPEQGFAPFTVSREWLERHKPMPGDYYVIYADDYRSVSPPEAFENGYTRIADDWRGRVVDEKRELSEKIDKLTEFLKSETGHKLPVEANNLLLRQLVMMEEYSGILSQRLVAAGGI